MDFKQFITEAQKETVAVGVGRFQPVSNGHTQLINKVKSVADEHNADALIVASHSEGTSKDPLPAKAKVGYLKHVAPEGTKVVSTSKESPTFLHAAAKLHGQGYKHLVMVAGSDRVDEYHKLLHKYNGVASKHGHYNFKSIKVVSAGQRDPDAEGVKGMSGTKMRAHARAGEMKQFKSGLPKALHPHADEIVSYIKAVPVKEDFDWETFEELTLDTETSCQSGSVWSTVQGKCVPIREAYHAQEIFNIGTIVESKNGEAGKIVYRGSSYVTIQLESGNTTKHWINDIKDSNKILNFKDFSPTISVEETNRLRKLPALLMSKAQLAELMSKLSAHKDNTFANKGRTTVPTFNEGVNAANFSMVPRIGPDGKPKFVKERNKRIITDIKMKDSDQNNIPDGDEDQLPSTKKALSSLRKSMNVQETVHRDINASPNKEVFHGIDIPIADQGYEGKPLGLASFKSFLANPPTQKAEAEHSTSYKSMVKAHVQDN